MSCQTHQNHKHEHNAACGHTKIKHNNHIDYVHGGHLHHNHGGHWDECHIDVSENNPEVCAPVDAGCQHNEDCGHERVPHGDHIDYLVGGRLQYLHGDHIDDHGSVELIK